MDDKEVTTIELKVEYVKLILQLIEIVNKRGGFQIADYEGVLLLYNHLQSLLKS
jgi:hypothetical protein